MPTIEDIANDIKTTLLQINQHTLDTANTVTAIKGDTALLPVINGTLQAGFQNLAGGLFAILEAEKLGNNLAEINIEQNRTIICWLSKIGDLLCREVRRLNEILAVLAQSRDATVKLELITELVHARETLEIDRLSLVEKRIEACCPPEVAKPEFCFEPCATPEVRPYHPQGQDWKPASPSSEPRK